MHHPTETEKTIARMENYVKYGVLILFYIAIYITLR